MEKSVDAVILWVDGSDPVYAGSLARYVGDEQTRREDCAAPTRFSNLGEIYRCVRSIRRFAPFIGRIFIVTDAQDPHIEGTTVIDHRVIYRGLEQYLPIFSSRSIETLIWRIPDLSERFIYFNDDFILRRPCRMDEFFLPDGRLVCRADYRSIAAVRLLSHLRTRYGYNDTLAAAATALGIRDRFLYIGHQPHPQLRSLLCSFYEEQHPELMLSNCSCRFRSRGQFNPAELGLLLARESGRCVVVPRRGSELYYKPRGGRNYTKHKLAEFEKHSSALSICVNSLDRACEEDRTALLDWLDRMLDNE